MWIRTTLLLLSRSIERKDSKGCEGSPFSAQGVDSRTERIKKLKAEHGKVQLGNITVDMVLGGMRGMTGLLWETSLLDAEEFLVCNDSCCTNSAAPVKCLLYVGHLSSRTRSRDLNTFLADTGGRGTIGGTQCRSTGIPLLVRDENTSTTMTIWGPS
ncbi:hypothetical protein POM88_045060 [Heracleum sosnowskyi]|uniref:Uncharacterized protein n=1 Tax=Heracleum sosnowskyi TaxID=360622 RepID=A0AAD8M4I3_9APIA|nr:hypothetical protein POM88_045060 [Heracleum sosnowskyi]